LRQITVPTLAQHVNGVGQKDGFAQVVAYQDRAEFLPQPQFLHDDPELRG
jgi:hypothetical protein